MTLFIALFQTTQFAVLWALFVLIVLGNSAVLLALAFKIFESVCYRTFRDRFAQEQSLFNFLVEYERKRVHYIRHSRRFFNTLSTMPGIHAYPTHANFMLIELKNGMSAEDLVCRLLVRRGIYARACDDKKGLEPGKFIRVASRTRSENRFVLRGFKDALR